MRHAALKRSGLKLMKNAMIAMALCVSLAGCAGAAGTPGTSETGGLSATGDQRGGKIPNGISDVPAANRAATAHCAQYNKRAMLTQMQTEKEGGLVAFECH
jgi:hypothetical protein